MREQILSFLYYSNDYISGEIISNKLGISRTAVWKHINKLRREGYVIASITNRGYKLLDIPVHLLGNSVKIFLNTNHLGLKIIHFDTIDSTNSKAKELAEKGYSSGTVIISEEQTSGKGRLGKNWVSPKYKGLWMSAILRPDISLNKVSLLTQIAGASIIKALEEMNINAGVKWPNDIIINNKKVAGILTEMSSEISSINYVVVGIGINIYQIQEDFPGNISDIATSLKIETATKISRAELCGKILNNLEFLYDDFIENENAEKSINICRKSSVLINKEIIIKKASGEYTGVAIALNNEGELVVKKSNGDIEYISSGEVSVRGTKGYAG